MDFYVKSTASFIISAIPFIIAPGSEAAYLITQSITSGKKVALASIIGIETGCFIYIVLLAFGFSHINQSLLKYTIFLGICYIFYLGLKALIFDKKNNTNFNNLKKVKYLEGFKQGFLINILNPTVMILFFSLISPHLLKNQNNFLLSLYLGSILIIFATTWYSVLVLICSKATVYLGYNPNFNKYVNKIKGGSFLLISIYLFYISFIR